MFRLGTRKSRLAVVQAESIQTALKNQGIETQLLYLESEGDQNLRQPLYAIEGATPGLFTKHLEQALLDGKIDLAVHSLKDLPTQQPEGLKVAAVPSRAIARDLLLISRQAVDSSAPLALKKNARVGTSSLRREAQLLSARSDLKIEPLRGNVPTRLERVRSGALDAVVLAEAGLSRLALELSGIHVVSLSENEFVPAPGQGALAVEVRNDCPLLLLKAIEALNDSATELCTSVERRILRELEGGCTLPLGVLCTLENDGLIHLRAFLGFERKKVGTSVRDWLGFEYFDMKGTEPEAVILATTKHFQEWMRDGIRNK